MPWDTGRTRARQTRKSLFATDVRRCAQIWRYQAADRASSTEHLRKSAYNCGKKSLRGAQRTRRPAKSDCRGQARAQGRLQPTGVVSFFTERASLSGQEVPPMLAANLSARSRGRCRRDLVEGRSRAGLRRDGIRPQPRNPRRAGCRRPRGPQCEPPEKKRPVTREARIYRSSMIQTRPDIAPNRRQATRR